MKIVMLSKVNSDSDFDELMEFIASERICCNINPIVKVFKHKACQNCFRKMRKAVSEIAMEWDLDSVRGIIVWEIE